MIVVDTNFVDFDGYRFLHDPFLCFHIYHESTPQASTKGVHLFRYPLLMNTYCCLLMHVHILWNGIQCIYHCSLVYSLDHIQLQMHEKTTIGIHEEEVPKLVYTLSDVSQGHKLFIISYLPKPKVIHGLPLSLHVFHLLIERQIWCRAVVL